MSRKPLPEILKREPHNRLGTKIDYALVSGIAYRGISGKDSNNEDEARPYVVLVSRLHPDTKLDISRQMKLYQWLEKHGIEETDVNPFRKYSDIQTHGAHLMLFNASDLPELRKLPRSIYIAEKEELHEVGVTKKLAPLLEIPLEKFRTHKNRDVGRG